MVHVCCKAIISDMNNNNKVMFCTRECISLRIKELALDVLSNIVVISHMGY